MGLDIYLYRHENLEDTQKKENEYNTQSEAKWASHGDYNTITTETKEMLRAQDKQLAESLGLDEWGCDKENSVKIEIDSTIDKEHYFKIGYFRSSYNDTGINRILDNLGVPGLYEIFDAPEEYIFQPDWNASLKRCEKSIRLLEKKGAYRCFAVSENIFGQHLVQNDKEAIQVLIDELTRRTETGGAGAYSNKNGDFWLDEPLQIMALIPGEQSILKKQSCTYVITKSENNWYLTALKIVKETIEWVLSQPDKNKYYLHWSG